MSDLYDAAKAGDLERVQMLVGKEEGRNEKDISLYVASSNGHFAVVRYLVEQGADMEKVHNDGFTSLIRASMNGHLEMVRYLLEQGANRDKVNNYDNTSLHLAANWGHLEIAQLLMVYGADLNARNSFGKLPIDVAWTEEIKQVIRDEPRRRMDHGHKRATEQDCPPNAAATASVQQEEEGKIADEDQDSEPSSDEDN